MQQLGAGAEKATQFYGQVAADAGTNNFVKEGNKLLYGDPDRIVQQPDGSMAPDKGYLNLPPEQQMAQRASVEQQLEQLRQTHREQLSTPESQLQFDEYSRREKLTPPLTRRSRATARKMLPSAVPSKT